MEEEEYEIGVNEIRELNQMSLDTFTFDKENMFESSANLVIKKQIQEKKMQKKHTMNGYGLKKYEIMSPSKFYT